MAQTLIFILAKHKKDVKIWHLNTLSSSRVLTFKLTNKLQLNPVEKKLFFFFSFSPFFPIFYACLNFYISTLILRSFYSIHYQQSLALL